MANILHVDIDQVNVTCGDTAASILGVGAFASRQTVTAGSSASEAAQFVAKKALDIASALMEAGVDDLELHDGEVRVKGVPHLKRGLGELARAVNGSIGFPLPGGIAAGTLRHEQLPSSVDAFFQRHPCRRSRSRSEDRLGENRSLYGGSRLWPRSQLHDSRRASPRRCRARHRCGLFEWMRYDNSGQPLTANYADYLLPTVDVVPHITIKHMESPSPLNPLGVKGAGEGGTIGAPAAIASAVEDALRQFNVRIRELPITPAKLYAQIELARRASASTASAT